jgi:carboxypeptidase Q
MSLRFPAQVIAVMLVVTAGVHGQEPVDREMVDRIKREGFERSRVEELFNQFTNVIGGRLTSSPAHREAVEYARRTLTGWGLDNVHLEAWEFGRGWTLERFSVELLEPRYMPLIGYPQGWSPSTDGRLVAQPVCLGDAAPETLADLAAWSVTNTSSVDAIRAAVGGGVLPPPPDGLPAAP